MFISIFLQKKTTKPKTKSVLYKIMSALPEICATKKVRNKTTVNFMSKRLCPHANFQSNLYQAKSQKWCKIE